MQMLMQMSMMLNLTVEFRGQKPNSAQKHASAENGDDDVDFDDVVEDDADEDCVDSQKKRMIVMKTAKAKIDRRRPKDDREEEGQQLFGAFLLLLLLLPRLRATKKTR